MLKGFRDFILRGNVLDLAVGVIIGAAFGAIVTSLVTDIFTPLIGLIFKAPDFKGIAIGANAAGQGGIRVGNFINALISFLLIALAVYFFIVVPANAIQKRMKKEEKDVPAAAPTRDQALLEEIRDALVRGR